MDMSCRQIAAPKRTKSRAGCSKCKERRLKCDETSPSCAQCTKKGFQCPGYRRVVKWSTKYEQHKIKTSGSERPHAVYDWFDRGVELATASIARPSMSPAATTSTDASEPEQSERIDLSTNSSALQSFTVIEAVSPASQNGEEELVSSRSISSACGPILDGRGCNMPVPAYQEGVEDLMELHLNYDPLSSTHDADLAFVLDDNSSWSLHEPLDPASIIVNHYFSAICRINSCFDSPLNPFRTDISSMLTSSALIWNCVLSMSAAHLFQNQKEKLKVALGYQIEAISCMATEVTRLCDGTDRKPENLYKNTPEPALTYRGGTKKELLLGIILLGISSTWHDPSSLGLHHLKGARSVFHIWLVENRLAVTKQPLLLNQEQHFLVSLMVYWEALCSFVVDQRTDTLNYLDQFCRIDPKSKIHPSPWTGASTPIFIYMAKVGILMRQGRIVHKLEILTYGSDHRPGLYGQLLHEAKVLEEEILRHRLPSIDMIEDTGDVHALPQDLIRVARCYRYCALLELYRTFPELVTPQNAADQDKLNRTDVDRIQAERVFDLACGILVIVQSIPKDSATNSIQTMVYLIAGSALQELPGSGSANEPDVNNLCVPSIESELDELKRAKVSVDSWRHFVRDRIINIYQKVGLDAVRNVASILEEVWSRMDAAHHTGDNGRGTWQGKSHWMDIMHEKKLETIMG